MPLIFQYGSNTSTLRINSQARLAGAARVVSLVRTVLPFELSFRVWSPRNGCAAADLAPGGGRTIWGVLYDIPKAYVFEDRCPPGRVCLDAVEGEGRNYVRGPIAVARPDGTTVREPVLTYTACRPVEGGRTSAAYARHILLGLAEHRAPAEYVRYVRRRVAGSLDGPGGDGGGQAARGVAADA